MTTADNKTTGHALLSPSSAKKWLTCPASIAIERQNGVPVDESSAYADEGTAAHELAADCLLQHKRAEEFIGRVIAVGERSFTVDADMAEHVQTYVDAVLALAGDDGELHVEQRLALSQFTLEPDAFGTSDAVILRGDEITVVDLKYGQGVHVSAETNYQLMVYAIAALDEYGLFAEFKNVRLVISQPRVSKAPSEWTCTVEELEKFRELVTDRARVVHYCLKAVPPERLPVYTRAEEDACRWCRAKATCPTLAQAVAEVAFDNPDAIAEKSAESTVTPEEAEALAYAYSLTGLVKMWCEAVSEAALSQARSGVKLPGFKLVQGRQGNRAWSSEEVAEEAMKSMRLKQDEMYTYKVISPTKAEALLAASSPRKWKKLQEIITRSEPGLTLAPESDKRQEVIVTPVENDFINETVAETCDDLF